MLRNRIEKVASYAPAPPNNGMHPTPNKQACYHQSSQGAGDAGRWIARDEGRKKKPEVVK